MKAHSDTIIVKYTKDIKIALEESVKHNFEFLTEKQSKNEAEKQQNVRGEWLQNELNAYFPQNKIYMYIEQTFMPLIYLNFFFLSFGIQSHSKLTEREYEERFK